MKESIKNLREKHNYSQSYLATYLEVSRQMYIKYESGEVEPPVHIVVKLAKLYKVSYDTIIDDKLSTSKTSVSYKINHQTQSTEKEVSSPAAFYSANPYNLQLENLITSIKLLPQTSLVSVAAFVKMLQTEQIAAKNVSKVGLGVGENSKKSKKAFFSLAGKLNLDSDSITDFREASLI